MNDEEIRQIEKIIGYAFKDRSLLERAFVHASYANEHHVPSYERLEFLGDGVLGLIIAEMLYKTGGDEGVMTVRRSMIVSSEPLEDATLHAGLDAYIAFGNGERGNDHSDSKVLADVFEALLGAVYLDGGYNYASDLVYRLLGDRISEVARAADNVNYKGELQEYCRAHGLGEVSYELISQSDEGGRPHFVSRVTAGGITADGEGRRKKDSERNAAKYALEKLAKRGQ